MELLVHYKSIPDGKTLDNIYGELADLMEDSGWFTGMWKDGEYGTLEIELEDEYNNPKHGILTVKNYLQRAGFAPDTTIELASIAVGIYE